MTAREAANHHDRYRIKERDSQQWVCVATFESEARWVGKVAQFQAGKKEFTAETRIREAGTATETGHLTIPQRGRPRLDFISSHNSQPASPKTILGCAWCLVDVHAKTFRLERNRTVCFAEAKLKRVALGVRTESRSTVTPDQRDPCPVPGHSGSTNGVEKSGVAKSGGLGRAHAAKSWYRRSALVPAL